MMSLFLEMAKVNQSVFLAQSNGRRCFPILLYAAVLLCLSWQYLAWMELMVGVLSCLTLDANLRAAFVLLLTGRIIDVLGTSIAILADKRSTKA